MDAKWIGAIALILGALIGFAGGVQEHHFAKERAIHLERLDNINSLRSETYVNFFAAMAKLQQARQFEYEHYDQLIKNRPEDSELAARLETVLWEYHAETKEARMKLAAFAPTELVEALADYYRDNFSQKPCSTSWKSDVQTYLAMRQGLLADIETKDVKPEKMFLLMWACRPPMSEGGEYEGPKN